MNARKWLRAGVSMLLIGGSMSAAPMTHATASLCRAALSRAEPKIILFLGDSLTAGYGVESAQAYPALIQAKIYARQSHDQVVRPSLSLETTTGVLRRIDGLLERKIDVLVL